MTDTHIPFYLRNFDWHPGELLKDEMEALGYSQKELASRLGLSPKVVCDLVKHKRPITHDYALLLERVLDRSAEYWVTLEQNWTASQKRMKENNELEKETGFVTKYKAKFLEDNGFVPVRHLTADRIRELLLFFRVASIESLNNEITKLNVAYRKRETKSGTVEARFVWLCIGRRIVESFPCSVEYNRDGFIKLFGSLRGKLTSTITQNDLVSMFDSVGVSLIFVPPIPGNGVYGASYWHCNHPVIQMQCAYFEDQFWFNLIHECHHVIHDGAKLASISCGDISETQTDENTSEWFVNGKLFDKFCSDMKFDMNHIMAFSKQSNLPPSIVIGMLQHKELIPYKSRIYTQYKPRIEFSPSTLNMAK